MIPKVFHQFWSTRLFPRVYWDYQASWLTHNPDWELRFWRPHNLFELNLQERYNDASKYVHPEWIPNWQSHCVRYEALHRFGGVWLDSDMACLRPLEGLLSDVGAFVAMDGPSQVQTAIMGSEPGHDFMADLIKDTLEMVPNPERIAASVMQVKRVLPNHPEVTIFEPWTFYPVDHVTGIGELGDAYGVHWPRGYASHIVQ